LSRWKRISVELSHSWPGEPYLRFEPADGGPPVMVAVDDDDLARIGQLQGALGVPPVGWLGRLRPQPATLTAELTLADGNVVHVPQDVRALAAAHKSRITVRVPCAAVPFGARIGRVTVRNEQDVEAAYVFNPPVQIPTTGHLDVTFSPQDLRIPAGWLPEEV
jgi:hypothetical protein